MKVGRLPTFFGVFYAIIRLFVKYRPLKTP